MSDFASSWMLGALPWMLWVLFPYVVAPLWALAGAVGAFGLFFRWKRSLGKAVGAAVVGSQLVPWLVLFTTASWDARGGVARAVGLGFLGALAVLVVWLRRGRAS